VDAESNGDRNCFRANEDFLYDQPEDLLALADVETVATAANPITQLRHRFRHTGKSRLVHGCSSQRTQVRLNRLLLLPKLRHPGTELVERQESFLIGRQQSVGGVC
jgi:hypothetical protein